MNITIWNENVHEKSCIKTQEIYPQGIHGVLRQMLEPIPNARITIATLDMPDAGLPESLLEKTDVLVWWGHMAHDQVPDTVVDRIHTRILKGMGFIALHSSHESKIFKKLMGTSCSLRFRDNCRERIFCIDPAHPIAAGVPLNFELPEEECYAELFDIPRPDELIFSSWFDIGEIFRSGCTWRRGMGKIFYFQPGHEENPSYHNPHVQQILRNACLWVSPSLYRESIKSEHINTPWCLPG